MTDPVTEPSIDTQDVVIIGSGFGGIGMGIQLVKSGLRSFVILEKAHDLGGTWRDNTYPGAACDVASVLYSFRSEPNLAWSRRYPPQHEVLAYLRGCAEKHGLERHFRFDTEVASARFEERTGRWLVSIADGRQINARILISAVGQLSLPNVPRIPGLDRFTGPAFHTARWNHDADLVNKRVAVVGSGSSAVQLAPPLAEQADTLYLFQRSAPYLIRKPNAAYSERDRARWRRLPLTQKAERLRHYLQREYAAIPFFTRPQRWATMTDRFMARLEREVPDLELRRKLTPDYPMGCKRIVVSDDFYDTATQRNVEVVTDPIRHITEREIVTADGRRRAVDAIVLATGFEATRFLAPMQIEGVGGRLLDDSWASGAEAYLGISVSGFPNFFMLFGPNTNLSYTSVIYMLERQIRYIGRCVDFLRTKPEAYIDVRVSSQAKFVRRIDRAVAQSVWRTGGCSSWYLDQSGRVTTLWPSYTFNYARRTRRFVLRDYRVERAAGPPMEGGVGPPIASSARAVAMPGLPQAAARFVQRMHGECRQARSWVHGLILRSIHDHEQVRWRSRAFWRNVRRVTDARVFRTPSQPPFPEVERDGT